MPPAPAPDLLIRLSTARLGQAVAIITAIVLTLGCLREILGALAGLSTLNIPFHILALDNEGSLPTWWESLLFAIAALLMLLCGALERRRGLTTWLGWLVLGAGFIYASLDESAALHERLGRLVDGVPDPTGGFLHFRWLMIGIPLVAIIGLLFVPFLLRLPRVTALRLVIAGTVFVGGAIGIEMLAAAVDSAQGRAFFTYPVLVMLEESLEMIGIVLGIRAVLRHMDVALGATTFHIGGA